MVWGALLRRPAMLVWDSFRRHLVEDTKKRLQEMKTDPVILGGLTHCLQPLDVSVNKPFKDSMRKLFSGTYVLKDIKSIGNEDLIYHKPVASLSALDFNHDKHKVKRPKNRLPMKDGSIERRSTLSIRLILKEFCIEFLNGAYNTLMHQVKEDLVRAKAQSNDESYYLWAMKFFMEFNRHYKFEVKLVSETMSLQSFHFVQTQLETYYEMMTSDKKKIHLWSRRMHIALRAYQELLMTLMAMDKSGDPSVQESARVIKSNIFYVIEYRELILTLMLNFDEIKMSRGYLKDLLETTHIFLKLLEHFCSRSRGVVVQQKQKARSRKKQKSSTANSQTATVQSGAELWIEMEPQITTILQTPESIPDDVVPFDPTSDIPVDDQKVDAITKIKTALKEWRFEEALALLRASR
ncbi:protein timeless homolog [Anabrus simplex]|uniref:protein timeless homolog n=1 Tax=Anabrus simplex TaxID=316456 RepID=UPI0035A2796E